MREKRTIQKINKDELFEILNKIKNDSESIKDNNIVYDYNGILIYIKNKIPATVKERYRKLYYGRREKGLCIRCGKPAQFNPKKNRFYRFCEYHRSEEVSKRKKDK